MSAGKGDKPRKVDGEKYRNNYDKIFRKSEPYKVLKSDENDIPVNREGLKKNFLKRGLGENGQKN